MAQDIEERLVRELSALPPDVAVHVWYDPERLHEEGLRFLLLSVAKLAERVRGSDVGPVSFDAPGAHVLVQPASPSEPRFRFVRAKLAGP